MMIVVASSFLPSCNSLAAAEKARERQLVYATLTHVLDLATATPLGEPSSHVEKIRIGAEA